MERSDRGNGHRRKPPPWEIFSLNETDPSAARRQAQAPHSIRARLARLGLRPRKGLGQNFLTDEYILDFIVGAAEVEPTDEVLEVGPGLGTLTVRLAERAGRVVAVELDEKLARVVSEELGGRGNVEVIHADVLQFRPKDKFRPRAYKLVGNLPYYVTSPIMRHFLENECPPNLMVVMLQREVAERVVARPGEMSLLAASVQFYGEPRLVRLVDAGAFYPPPKVDSAVVRIDVFPRPAVPVEPGLFFTVVSAGFSQPRKQLHNSLSQRLWMRPGQSQALLREAGIDPRRRAETLSLEEWGRLCDVLLRAGVVKPRPSDDESSSNGP